MGKQMIVVVGYPRSGNTWLSRLLGECLDSPVSRLQNAIPIAEEGLDRKGSYVIHQMHLKPLFGYDYKSVKELFPSSYLFNTWRWTDEKLVQIVRDPRDVAVSVMHYWGIPSLTKTIRCMGESLHPVSVHGPWNEFVSAWREVIPYVQYEELLKDPRATLEYIFREFEIDLPREEIMEQAIYNQSFENKRAVIEGEQGTKRPYGKTIQLKAMRKGVAGDWRNYFTEDHIKMIVEYFGIEMYRLGYER
jgi:hypothetical protein